MASDGTMLSYPEAFVRHTPLPPPAGVRDLGPAAAAPVYSVQNTLIGVMRQHGFERVMTPSFDDVRALAPSGEPAHGLFRFVDPDTGQVVALRDDVTPQVARLVATRLGVEDAPFRLCYSARVYRQRSHFGIAPRELIQAGAELIGASGMAADLEILELAVRCAEALELSHALTFALGHSAVVRELLRVVGEKMGAVVAAEVADACRRRALPRLVCLASEPALVEAFGAVLVGDSDLAAKVIGDVSPKAALALEELEELRRAAAERLPETRWTLDLAGPRGFDYYTGFSVMGLLDGVGRPLISGGRYDDLVGRFGPDMDAVGFMVDEQAVLEALAMHGRAVVAGSRDVLVVNREGTEAVTGRLVDALRGDRSGAPLSVVRSINPYRWCDCAEDVLVERLKHRRFKRLVFVDLDGFELVDASGTRRRLGDVAEVVSAARH